MVLIKEGRAVADTWQSVSDEEALPASGSVIVTLARWKSDKAALLARGEGLGIVLSGSEQPAEIAEELGAFGVIALEFPKFTDGRAYSYARLLRERYGYTGELRAVGNVLVDQLQFMHRCGFDAYEVEERVAARWGEALGEIAIWYQPTGDNRPPLSVLRHRRSAAE